MGNGNNGSKGGNLLSRVAYSFGNVGQSAFYNALSTYFIVYVTSSLFSGVDKSVATKLIGIITGLVVVIRIAEIFIDPLLGNIIDNTNTKWGRFKPWQLIGGTVSAILLVLVYTGLFGLVNVNTTLFIVLFIITFIVLDVFYSLRDISYWGMIPGIEFRLPRALHLHRTRLLRRLHRLQRSDHRGHPDRHLLQLGVHRQVRRKPVRLDLLRHHRGHPRHPHRVLRGVRHQGKHHHAACQGRRPAARCRPSRSCPTISCCGLP